MKTVGLDIGIASVGWSYVDLENSKIIDAGVRIFERAENPKDGASLAEPRRLARGARRRTRRKRQRLDKVLSLMKEAGLPIEVIVGDEYQKSIQNTLTSPWKLRADAIHRILTPEETVQVIYHIAKRRGFQSNRKSSSKASEEGALLEGARLLQEEMQEKGYQTIGELLAHKEKPKNRSGQYNHTVFRDLLRRELDLIFEKQKEFGNKFLSDELKKNIEKYAFHNNPLKSSISLVGKCTFESQELRAPKMSPTAEHFVGISKVNNLKLTDHGTGSEFTLTQENRLQIIQMAFEKASVTFKQIRKELGIPENYLFNLATYRKTKEDQDTFEKIKENAEKAKLLEFKGFHELRKAISTVNDTYWNEIKDHFEKLDQIVFAYTFFNEEEEVRENIPFELPQEIFDELLKKLQLKGTVNLSLKALYKILPLMKTGLRYDEACLEAGYHHSRSGIGSGSKLPVFENLRNPVVQRALTQARKVINMLVREYGMPDAFNIELARDLSRPWDERKKIERIQKGNQEYKNKILQQAEEFFERIPSSEDFLKFRLWKEQEGFCFYSGNYIEPNILKDPLATQIDHALPYSRTYNDSWANKVLCLTDENQKKGNQTPFEYLDPKGRWEAFQKAIDRLPFNKKRLLLTKNLDEKVAENFKERNLNDTRYIARELKSHIQNNLKPNSNIKTLARTRSGQLTARLRGLWGFPDKNREDNDLHHAIDATVVACTTEDMVQKVARWSKYAKKDDPNGLTCELAKPWENFRDDVLSKAKEIFISRAPSRKGKGPLHKETIKSVRIAPDGKRKIVKRMSISDLKIKDLQNLVDAEIGENGEVSGRNKNLYKVLFDRLMEFGDDPKKAFEKPVYMPAKEGKQAPQILGVNVITSDKSGVPVHRGIADNGAMVRVDVFEHKGKFYLSPVYTYHIAKKELPNRVIKAHTDEENWPEINDDYHFLFSLYTNDYFKVTSKKGEVVEGYYIGTHRGTGSMNYRKHLGGKDSELSTGILNMKTFEKYQVDIKGKLYKVHKESRRV